MNIAVIGAGVIGYAVAFELSGRGAHVRIFDMRAPGQGATRASAGMLAPHIEAHEDALRQLGTASLGMYDSFVARVSHASGHAVEYRPTGTLEVSASSDGVSHLEARAARLGALGVAHRLLAGSEIQELEPQLSAQNRGLLIPEHRYVKAADLMRALQVAAGNNGVTFTRQRIDDPDPATLNADAVIIATGSWSSALLPSLPVKPIRGQVVQLRLPNPLITRVVWGNGCYLVPWRDGSMLVGATSEDVGFDESTTEAGTRQLLDAASAVLPGASGGTSVEVRAGLRPVSPDELPLIGPSSAMPGVYFATGHYRNGVLLAPLTARLIADLVLAGREDALLDYVRPARFNL